MGLTAETAEQTVEKELRGRGIVLGTLLKLPVVDKSHCSEEIHMNA